MILGFKYGYAIFKRIRRCLTPLARCLTPPKSLQIGLCWVGSYICDCTHWVPCTPPTFGPSPSIVPKTPGKKNMPLGVVINNTLEKTWKEPWTSCRFSTFNRNTLMGFCSIALNDNLAIWHKQFNTSYIIYFEPSVQGMGFWWLCSVVIASQVENMVWNQKQVKGLENTNILEQQLPAVSP